MLQVLNLRVSGGFVGFPLSYFLFHTFSCECAKYYIKTKRLTRPNGAPPIAAEHTFLSAQGTFSRTDHTLVHKASLSKLEIGILQTTFSNHNGIKPEIYTRRKMKIHTYIEIEHTF